MKGTAFMPVGTISEGRATFSLGRNVCILVLVSLLVVGATQTTRAVSCDDPSFITREEAQQVVIDEVITGDPHETDLVAFSHSIPLEDGTEVQPFFVEDGESMHADGCAWLFYLMLTPESVCGPTKFVLVGGTSAVPEHQVTDQSWWPVVDGIGLYDDPEANIGSPDIFFGALPEAEGACVVPPDPPQSGPDPSDDSREHRWAMLFNGQGTFDNDPQVMYRALKHANGGGVPEGNIEYFDGFDKDELERAVTRANDAGATMVYVYIVAHGHKDKSGDLIDDYRRRLTVAQVRDRLSALHACSVHVILVACYSGNHVHGLVDALIERPEPLNAHDPATMYVFTSSSATKATKQSHKAGNPGTYYTQQLAKYWTEAGKDLAGAHASVLTGACAKAKSGDPQLYGESLFECGQGVPVDTASWGCIKGLYR